MDRRIIKTKKAVYAALMEGLKIKGFEDITVEDLLNRSHVSRSAFYSHFKKKEDVLESLLDEIFDHVFSSSLSIEHTHDFSKESIFDYAHLFTHLFYHFRDEKEFILAVLTSSSRNLFTSRLREKCGPLIERSFSSSLLEAGSLPLPLAKARAKENFITLVLYWFESGMMESPETLTNLFLAMSKA